VLNIKVETIHRVGLEWTRIGVGVGLILRTERVPQEVGEPDGLQFTAQILPGSLTTNGQHDRVALLLTDRDILPDLVAATEKLRPRVDIAIALVAKVRAWPFTDSLGEDVDEAKVDDIQRSLFTEVAQTLLIRTLAL
jgi:hypothetical protein